MRRLVRQLSLVVECPFLIEYIGSSEAQPITKEINDLISIMKVQKEDMSKAFLLEIRKVQAKNESEEKARRELKERKKVEARAKQDNAEDAALPRSRLLSTRPLCKSIK